MHSTKVEHRWELHNYLSKPVVLGYFRKYSTPPSLWRTLKWVTKNFRISKKNNSSFCKIPNPADSKSWGILEFCKTLNGSPGTAVKIHKSLGKFMDFQAGSPFIHCRISNVVHGGVWIFSGIALHLPRKANKI